MSSALVGQRVALKPSATRKPKTGVQVIAAVQQARKPQVATKVVSKKPQVLTKASELRLLGKAVTAAEELGLIGIIESVGPSLSTIEKLGLLSKGEALIYDRSAPGSISALGAVVAAVGAAAVYTIPDDSTTLVALQVVLAGACALGLGAALTGSSLLRKLQN
eukprot:CAMPEP_0198679180 /NCGR_PEP_ID=MMETSP1468-20131203/2234_1 /TAXON_ID=1461545 /ORGANISM="Mantoniella sp, Strain CCMP1436" /LENGTH=162 /DNA_ID=CAMNT_0044417535 /DNA_START=119 /DNA_END=607 /DNA_ORIENTATION=+